MTLPANLRRSRSNTTFPITALKTDFVRVKPVFSLFPSPKPCDRAKVEDQVRFLARTF